jgi:type II secretory pathway pseudopilin PulG
MSRVMARVRRADGQRGLTLVELLVGSTLFLLLSGLVLGSTVTTSRVAKSQRETNDLNEEARVLLNRMSRELREAKEIRAVQNPVGYGHNPAADTLLTFWVDLNGDGTDVVPTGGDPEVITYRFLYAPSGGRVLLQVPGQTEPVLAGQVTKFALTFTSSKYLNDGSLDGVKDGTVTWEELDAYPAGSALGNGNRSLDALELQSIDSVKVDFTVFQEPRTQNYQTRVALRNKT